MVIKTYGRNESTKQLYTFEWPYLLAKGLNGELLVGNNHKDAKHLVVFDKQLKYSRVICHNDKKFGVICGIAVNSKGFVYFTDGELNCIWKFTLDTGKFIAQFGTKGDKKSQFDQPAGLLVSKCNLLFVCDRQNHRVQVFQEEHFFMNLENTVIITNLVICVNL